MKNKSKICRVLAAIFLLLAIIEYMQRRTTMFVLPMAVLQFYANRIDQKSK